MSEYFWWSLSGFFWLLNQETPVSRYLCVLLAFAGLATMALLFSSGLMLLSKLKNLSA